MIRRHALTFMGTMLLLRVAIAAWACEATLFPSHPEEVGRYWFLERWWTGFNPLDPSNTAWTIYTVYAPWLPLPILAATPLQFLPGSIQPYAFSILQALVAALGTIGAGLAAWFLVGREAWRWPAATVAAAVTLADPRVVVLGVGLMTDQYHLSASALGVAGLLAAWRGERWGRPLFFGALWLGMLSRYESWLLLPLCWLALAAAERPFVRRRALRDLALIGAFPLSWIAYHAAMHGDPLHFVRVTQIYFKDHVAPDQRITNLGAVVLRIGWVPLGLAAAAVAIAAIPGAYRRERLALALVPWVHFGLMCALLAMGASATMYPERTFLAMVVLAAPLAGWGGARLLEAGLGAEPAGRAPLAAGAIAGLAIAAASVAIAARSGGADYSARLLLREVKAALAEAGGAPDGSGAVVLMDSTRPTSDMVCLGMVLPRRVTVAELTTTTLVLAPESARVVVAKPEQFDWRDPELGLSEPRRVRAWTDDWDVHLLRQPGGTAARP
jgi:hypothetical protein